MAVGDLYRRLVYPTLTETEIGQKLFIPADIFQSSMLCLITATSAAPNTAAVRIFLNLPVGTSAGDEFTDVITSANSLPGTGEAKRRVQRQVLADFVAALKLASRGNKLPNEAAPLPFPDGNSVRLYLKALIQQEGGTPAGSLAV